ncbi:hypothetical protein GUY44_07025 [Pimelobacter simplex]|uniref:Replicative DNA helicase (DnaB) n=1 Tax=Nocardioides simplex TaxID=2045 RepID=A0A0C5XB42_NOCSI|nr:DnaB-like helicase N-terminal domain-containing protein [Pimelobacter simplex]AJR18465.1 Replicative DNA helicase (DnaB) [Pimelobacter simplex]MCG8150224.1 hypothetical protein [Pimelobacter simplex]GEB13566.1 hypothetical protein NSI01_18810 [Pimelobacter simplex]SFM71647.1 recA DNA recombination protein [Pimelobacter simplex]
MSADGTPPRHHLHAVDHPTGTDEPPFDPDYDKPFDDRRPVASRDAERAVLGALLLEPTLIPELRDELTAADFYWPEHATVWHAVHDLADTGRTVDAVLVADHLIRTGDIQRIGGATYLHDLMQACAIPANAGHYATIVRDTARLRGVATIGQRFLQLARTGDPSSVTMQVETAYEELEQIVTRWGPATHNGTGLIDLSWVNGGTPPVVDPPTVCRRVDGAALFYAGKVNGIFGDPECGKTWLAQAAIVEALNAGDTAAMVDVDHNGPNHTAARLLLLGARLEHIADSTRFRYYQPEDGPELRAAIDDVVRHAPDVVLIDSIGEAIPMLGANTNDGDEISGVMRLLCTRPADAGSCVITIDHLPKSTEARTSGYAIGSIAKKRMIRGTYLRAEARTQPAPGQIGRITLRIEKDTAGELRKASGGGYAGTLTLDSTRSETHGITNWSIAREEAPKNDDGTFRPTKLMEAISRYVEDNDQCTQRDIENDVAGKGTYLRHALKLLVTEGFISTIPGARNSRLHHSIALYREAEDDHVA